jgi:hypothetical protein
MKGVSPGAALVFLMAGPATNVATMTVLGKTMGRRSLIVYLSTIIGGAIIFGLLTNWLLPTDFILNKVMHIHSDEAHEMLPKWLQITSTVVLVSSMILGYFLSIFQKKSRMKKVEGITVTVKGMTCSHCEATVKRNLEALDGVSYVVADNKSGSVKISGTKIHIDKIKDKVNGLGYQFVD